ncbi:mycothiol synthase [Rhodococcus sp. Leaf7]|uniref:mycothiol synthase n=1 Tax=unclassified Rhodococcus (in: high G+C Gram-positive bacteria) TaxID=192944 RepID=UPI0006FD0A83|nr:MULTISPECIES: mycothiol synthase [unclassified Rhodococcus (in: high G+C Gram-positive bacteria)]KQU06872.1 mycothiol synthase [Rhodococcus sp. Leaf7]KQU42391.1 mycothiol synthase [Rhodococcus sp. Leaf247]
MAADISIDSRRPTPEEAQLVRDAIARATVVDGTPPLSEQAERAVESPRDDEHLLALDDGRLVGYATLAPEHGDTPAMAEVVVHPDARGRGIGTQLVERALPSPTARVWAHGRLPSADRVAEKLGLTVVRELLQMRRPLGSDIPLPELPVREGITLRTYRDGDDAEILRVNNAAFAWHPEQGGWTGADIDERRAEDWFDPEGLFVATSADDPDTILGFHWTKVHPPTGDDPELGEVYVVGIDPNAQGKGLGALLTLAGLRYLADRELPAVLLYVESDNTAAVHTYSKLGFTTFHVDAAFARA